MNTLLEKTYQILHQENIEKEESVFQKPRKHSFHFNDFSIPQTRKINPQKFYYQKHWLLLI